MRSFSILFLCVLFAVAAQAGGDIETCRGLWESTGKVLLRRTSFKGSIHYLPALSADGRYFAAVGPSSSRILSVLDLTTGDTVRFTLSHQDYVTKLAIAQGGQSVFLGTQNGELQRIDQDGRFFHQSASSHASPIHALGLSFDGAFAATASGSDLIFWNTSNLKIIRRFNTKTKINRVAISPNNNLVVAGTMDNKGAYLVWHKVEPKHFAMYEFQSAVRSFKWRTKGSSARVNLDIAKSIDTLEFSKDGQFLVAGIYLQNGAVVDEGRPNSVVVVDPATWQVIARRDLKFRPRQVAMTPDNENIIVVGTLGEIQIYTLKDESDVREPLRLTHTKGYIDGVQIDYPSSALLDRYGESMVFLAKGAQRATIWNLKAYLDRRQ